MSLTWRARATEPELMDEPTQSRSELNASLAHVASVNRWLGGLRSLRAELATLRSENLRVLDVGTGNGDVLRRLVRWSARAGGRWRGFGVDIHPDVLALASEKSGGATPLPLARADALALPFADGTFDVALCTLTLHHFPNADAIRLLKELARVARRLVVVSDLERSRFAYLFARVFAMTWWRGNRITRHDGPVSVLRSFTSEELGALGRRAGLGGYRVTRHFPFRLTLGGRP